MKRTIVTMVVIGLLLGLANLPACVENKSTAVKEPAAETKPAAAKKPAAETKLSAKPKVTLKIPELGKLSISPPFVHKNLTLFVLYDDRKELGLLEPDYITLEEGIAAGSVKITEDKNEQVRKLLVSNLSEKPLFIQAGEVIKGGKQDRTIGTSIVIPPNTKKAPIPALCVEHRRWSGGNKFHPANITVTDRKMKLALQTGDQSGMWENARKYKRRANLNLGRKAGEGPRVSESSSLNEELDNKDFQKLIQGYESAAKGLLAKYVRPLGLATVIDGEISVVDIYHSSILFRKLYPKLLKSAAAEAAAGKIDKEPEAVTTEQLKKFLATCWEGKSKREDKLGFENVLVRIVAKQALTCYLKYKNALVHIQVIRAEPQELPKVKDSLDVGPTLNRPSSSSSGNNSGANNRR